MRRRGERRRPHGRLVAVTAAAAAAAALTAPPAPAFDTAPHFDITGDALSAEGFGRNATRVAQVGNWFNDLYVNAKDVPQSGHASWWKTLLGARWYLGEIESWSPQVIAAGTAMHFDSNNGGLGYRRAGDLDTEMYRLLDMTVRVCRLAKPDPLACLTAIGTSLHEVQDFYSHTNWVEPRFGERPGYDGPGWASRGLGDTPTWFDLPLATRDPAKSRVYTNGTPDEKIDYADKLFNRGHGSWKSDANKQLATKMNKDWPGRPRYVEAYIASYFASRQWVQVVRREVNDEAYWKAVLSYRPPSAKARADLSHDVRKGARGVSYWTGHWQGQGEPTGGSDPGPGGSLDDVFFATREYFSRERTIYRTTYETVVRQLRQQPSPLQRFEVPSSRPMQESTRFVRVQVLRMKGRGAGDPGPDEADFYAAAVVGGQEFLSAFIHGEDSYSFRRPNYPFTFLKAVTVGEQRPQSVTSLQVRVRTSATDGAGTDDNVYLRISDQVRFQLDRLGVDDFERGSVATYSLPVDSTTPFDNPARGLLLGDIRYVQLEKSKDGRSGAWKLGGVTVWANGNAVYRNDRIERWLRGSTRTWRAPELEPTDGLADTVPVWLSLWEADSFLYGGDDHADLNVDFRRRNVGVNYRLGTVFDATVFGGKRFGGPLSVEGDRAEIRFRIETIGVDPPPLPPPPPPPPPAGKPDLVITQLDATTFTVRNQGNAAAGPFSVQVVGYNTIAFAGLAAGAEEKRTYTSGCGFGIHEARADYLNQVDESDETNNTRTIDVIC